MNIPENKNMNIINAALEVFSKYEYKNAITDDIAHKAGISKGLLFHYFKNKKSLYKYIFNYSSQKIIDALIDDEFYEIDDFFDLIIYSSRKKIKLLEDNPYILDFFLRAIYYEDKDVEDIINPNISHILKVTFNEFFINIDFSKFKDHIHPIDIYNMIFWMAEGYLNQNRRDKNKIVLDQIMVELEKWVQILKPAVYK
ncbi:TetR/AcrR family transcriptional regulator [Anaerosalibacter massiliensis]|uniref:TetR/AcrR family transcriptional regulator n=1 Tax=Anaerosalibacter massiliensis TaxID=1347392 RepID=A0A9X2MNK2_9FIRM|nr:TetR/AcrR family transcriptional regulator [Anaerosalibacter massiliensis]MCR2044301.1 TetR/AcrR family transcriptional regulator [Anaerosalibacter massiliensis]